MFVNVTGLISGVLAIVGKGRNTYAIITDSNVQCWGELTTGSVSNQPVGITLSGAATAIAAMQDSDGAVVGGALYTWTSGAAALAVGLSSGVAKVDLGDSHACVLMTSGTMKCWGQNGGGQLGNNSKTDSLSTPVTVVAFPD